jgi:uncharacterized membrane protein
MTRKQTIILVSSILALGAAFFVSSWLWPVATAIVATVLFVAIIIAATIFWRSASRLAEQERIEREAAS